MEKYIVINQTIVARDCHTFIGKGAKINLDLASRSLLLVLQRTYAKDPLSLSGDVDSLQMATSLLLL